MQPTLAAVDGPRRRVRVGLRPAAADGGGAGRLRQGAARRDARGRRAPGRGARQREHALQRAVQRAARRPPADRGRAAQLHQAGGLRRARPGGRARARPAAAEALRSEHQNVHGKPLDSEGRRCSSSTGWSRGSPTEQAGRAAAAAGGGAAPATARVRPRLRRRAGRRAGRARGRLEMLKAITDMPGGAAASVLLQTRARTCTSRRCPRRRAAVAAEFEARHGRPPTDEAETGPRTLTLALDPNPSLTLT